jgi:dienelactone hydrolase
MRTKLRSLFAACVTWLTPSPRAWHGAAWAVMGVTAVIWLITGYIVFTSGEAHVGTWLVYLAVTIAAPATGLLIRLAINLMKARDRFYSWTLPACLVVLALALGAGGPGLTIGIAFTVALAASLLGAGIAALTRSDPPQGKARVQPFLYLFIGVFVLGAGAGLLIWDGKHRDAPPNAASGVKRPPLTLPDPSLPGPFKVRTMTYGSGSDKHRPEFAAGAAIKTKPVDGSAFIENWKGRAGWARTHFWGFDSKKLPVQGRVWYPEGPGPFPLALIVHGNHGMEDYSDPGYGYLGELMASRGIIFVSVDENFLNSSLSDLLGMPDAGLTEENDARGWMLLEHVRVWTEWNQAKGNPFQGRVDTGHIALLGHSRGGEAVAVAAAFNRLPYYPDNARIKLGYNYAIRGVAAIAPVDGQYKPAGIGTPLENVNYFVLHGAADGDVQSFHGSRVYQRVKFTGKEYHFASTLYINDANHGQFNTGWGRFDNGPDLGARLLNYAQIMPGADQRRIAKVYLSAYLETILHDQTGYLPLFQDHRVAPGWLPDSIYLHQFRDSTYQMVATYEEDIDVSTTTMPGGKCSGERLCDWKERMVKLKWGDMDTRAVFLGWNTKESGGPGSYTITLPETGMALEAKGALIFSMADAKNDPSPFDPDKKDDKDKKDKDKDKKKDDTSEEKKKEEPIDLTIEVTDASGQTARLPLSSAGRLQRQIPTHVMKFDWMAGTARFEPLFQSFEFALSSFVDANPKLKPETLRSVRFLFDRTEKGMVILDDVGFRGGPH